MSFFKLRKRCPYCAHVLNEKGECENPKCINYKGDRDSETTTEEDKKDSSDGSN